MFFFTAIFGRLSAGPTLSVPANVDVSPWDRLLKTYVNELGLVNYQAWKSNPADLKALDAFVSHFDDAPEKAAQARKRSSRSSISPTHSRFAGFCRTIRPRAFAHWMIHSETHAGP